MNGITERLCQECDQIRGSASLLLAVLAVLILSLPSFAQVNTGRILGTVTDQTGGAVANSAVTVTNTQTGVARNLTADAAGAYVAPNLNAGTYSVRCTAMGFQAFERQNVQVDVGQDARVDCQLTPGQVTQTIQVTESAVQLDTTSAVVSGTINAQAITDLPLNGRDFEQLLPLRPGVVQTPGGGSLTTATNGLPPQFNNYFIEGLDNNEPFTGQSVTNTTLPFGGAASLLPVDAIQELNVETNAPAEFGRRPGAVVNVGIKTGTNNVHGTAYAFGRDGSWDAQDFSNPVAPKQPLEMEQWGGTIGGPIKKNKLFYYGGFERQYLNVGNAFPSLIPTTNASVTDPNISIPAAENGLAAQSMTPSATSLKLLSLFPANTSTSDSMTFGFPNTYSINNAVAKIDYHLSDHHTIAGSYFFGSGHALGEDNPFVQQEFETIGDMRAQFLTTSWTWTPNSTWVNDVRFGWNHYDRFTNVGDYQTPSSTYGLNTGVTGPLVQGLPNIQIGGFNFLGGDTNNPKKYGPASDFDFVDHVSWLHGKHAFKFGADFFFYHMYYDAVSSGRGQINFTLGGQCFAGSTSLEDFLCGAADNPSGVTLLEGDPARNFREYDISGFFEDSWRATSKLTVNLGLRYEYYTPLSEAKNLIGNWSPAVGFEQVGVNTKSAYNADPADISPRAGIAWDVTGKGTTVIRAGAGLYFAETVASWYVGNVMLPGRPPGISSIPTGYTLYSATGTPQAPLLPVSSGGIGSTVVTIPGTALNWNQTGGGTVYPASSLGGTNGFACGNGLGTNPSPCSILATDSHLPAPRVGSWNVGVQRALSSTISAEVDYIGNHGFFLPAIADLNQVNPNSPAEIANGHKDAITSLPYYSQYPYLRYINFLTDTDYSNYNALQATLTARNFHNLSFIAGYTYSRALTDEQGTGYTQRLPQNSLNPNAEYGPTNFDQTHHFSFTPTYNIPSRKAPLQLLSGWSIQSAVLITSGFPYSVRDTRNITGVNEQADRWDFFGNPSDFTAGPNAIPFYSASQAPSIAPCAAALTALASAGGTLARGCYSRGNSAMIAPTAGFFGTTPRNFFRGPNYADWDFSIFKNTTIKERLTAQFRAEIFNILNHPNYAGPDGNPRDTNATGFGCACSTPDQNATNPYLGTGAARELQLGLKLIF